MKHTQTTYSNDSESRLDKYLKEDKGFCRSVFEISAIPIIMLDMKGRIKLFNKASQRRWNLSFEEVKNKFVGDYYESTKHAKDIGKKLGQREMEIRKEHELSEGASIKNYDVSRDTQAIIKIKKDNEEKLVPINLYVSYLLDEKESDGKKEKIGTIGIFESQEVQKKRELLKNIIENSPDPMA